MSEYNYIQEEEEVEIENHDKCLFYTFFLGFTGYLLYYILKDTV